MRDEVGTVSMRLSEALSGVGRPIAYFPELAKFLGGVKAGILFCQLFYWSERTDEKSSEFWKSQQELVDETGLTIEELRSARKQLDAKGVVRSRYARIEHRLYFKIDRRRLDQLWVTRNGHIGNSDMPPWDSPNGHAGNVDFVSDPEITSKTTNRERRDKSRTPSPVSKNSRKPETAWPENLKLTPEMTAEVRALGVDAEHEFEAWRRVCAQKNTRNSDWRAAWSVWVMRAEEFERKRAGATNGNGRAKLLTIEELYDEAKA